MKNNDLTKAEAIKDVADAIERLGFGKGADMGFGALEGLAFAIAGSNLRYPLGESIVGLTNQAERIADALESIALSLKQQSK